MCSADDKQGGKIFHPVMKSLHRNHIFHIHTSTPVHFWVAVIWSSKCWAGRKAKEGRGRGLQRDDG